MHIAAFTVGAVALAATGGLAAGALRLRGSAFLLAAYIVAWAELVVVTEVLSLTDTVGRTGYLAVEAVLLMIVVIVARRRGVRFRTPGRPALPALRPELVLLAVVVLVAVSYQAFLVVATPPNNANTIAKMLNSPLKTLSG